MNKAKNLSKGSRVTWRIAQVVVFAFGIYIIAMLLLQPEIGLYLLWDVLIPILPLIFVLVPGVWRNICPLATFSMLPHQLNISKKKILSLKWQARFLIIAVSLLMIIVPLRHAVLDQYGVITGIVLLVVAVVAFGLGLVFDWKSAWCSGICPVYPVELLYGSRPILTVQNMQCRTCTDCVKPCRDSVRGATPVDVTRYKSGKIIGLMLIACFPGFIIAWFNVKFSPSTPLINMIIVSYTWAFMGAVVSIITFVIMYKLSGIPKKILIRVYAATAVSLYYWFKLPVVLGMSGDGTHALINLGVLVPDWAILSLRISSTILLYYLLLARPSMKGWMIKPESPHNPLLINSV